MTTVTAVLGLGSNLGDRVANLCCAVDQLMAAGVQIAAVSGLYETEPWGVTDQGPFLNAAIRTIVMLSPGALLAACKNAETACGRGTGPRWGPRVVDVDVLTYGTLQLDKPDLKIPHPYLRERRFALAPLQEVAVTDLLPGGHSIAAALQRMARQELQRIAGPEWLVQRRLSP